MSKRFSAQFKQEAVQLVSAERPISEVARQSASIKNAKRVSLHAVMVERRRIELPTFALRTRRSPS